MPEFFRILHLSSLNGANGFEIRGEALYDGSGLSVSGAGDVNGDGFADVIIGALNSDVNGNGSGASYVVFGSASGFAATLDLSALNGANGFEIRGETTNQGSGLSVSGAGDVNGDGFDDLVIGALGTAGVGTSHVVFGKAGGFGANLQLSGLNGANGFELRGGSFGDNSGYSVSDAGDFNGDGIDDLLIGARRGDDNGYDTGSSYVVFGRTTRFAPELTLPAGGFEIRGEGEGDWSGSSASSAGDVNGDGFDDVFIGAPYGEPDIYAASAGKAYVVFGKARGLAAGIDLSALNGRNGFEIIGEAASDFLGRSVASAGDINGDGRADLIVGAHGAPNSIAAGASYVIFGQPFGFASSLVLSTLNGINGFKISGQANGDASGRSVSSAGDVNGDGFDDLLIGAPRATPNGYNSGESYVVFGKARGFSAALDLSALNGDNGFKIRGEAAGDGSGGSVSAAGDVNGDGFDDLLIGAPGVDANGLGSGASYVVFGHRALDSVTRVGTFLAQTINGGTGADRIWGSDGEDVLVGWEGDDIYLLSDVNGPGIRLNYDRVVEAPGGGDDTLIVVALNNNLRLADAHSLAANVENAGIVGTLDFNLAGNELDNLMAGNAANNFLLGRGGDDRLLGRNGDDTLTGGLGRDSLAGGDGNDRFDYETLAETRPTPAGRDTIEDFTHLADIIGLAGLDAIAGGVDQAFAFRGLRQFTAPGQLRLAQQGPDTIILLNTEGADIAEAAILLKGVTATTLTSADFVL